MYRYYVYETGFVGVLTVLFLLSHVGVVVLVLLLPDGAAFDAAFSLFIFYVVL